MKTDMLNSIHVYGTSKSFCFNFPCLIKEMLKLLLAQVIPNQSI